MRHGRYTKVNVNDDLNDDDLDEQIDEYDGSGDTGKTIGTLDDNIHKCIKNLKALINGGNDEYIYAPVMLIESIDDTFENENDNQESVTKNEFTEEYKTSFMQAIMYKDEEHSYESVSVIDDEMNTTSSKETVVIAQQ